MEVYRCECGNTLTLKNDKCLVCGRKVGFLPDVKKLSTIKEEKPNQWVGVESGRLYRKCVNYNEVELCNWMIPVEKKHRYCNSCRTDAIYKNSYSILLISITSLIALVFWAM